jgi:hypothetical protein
VKQSAKVIFWCKYLFIFAQALISAQHQVNLATLPSNLTVLADSTDLALKTET